MKIALAAGRSCVLTSPRSALSLHSPDELSRSFAELQRNSHIISLGLAFLIENLCLRCALSHPIWSISHALPDKNCSFALVVHNAARTRISESISCILLFFFLLLNQRYHKLCRAEKTKFGILFGQFENWDFCGRFACSRAASSMECVNGAWTSPHGNIACHLYINRDDSQQPKAHICHLSTLLISRKSKLAIIAEETRIYCRPCVKQVDPLAPSIAGSQANACINSYLIKASFRFDNNHILHSRTEFYLRCAHKFFATARIE